MSRQLARILGIKASMQARKSKKSKANKQGNPKKQGKGKDRAHGDQEVRHSKEVEGKGTLRKQADQRSLTVKSETPNPPQRTGFVQNKGSEVQTPYL